MECYGIRIEWYGNDAVLNRKTVYEKHFFCIHTLSISMKKNSFQDIWNAMNAKANYYEEVLNGWQVAACLEVFHFHKLKLLLPSILAQNIWANISTS